MRRFLSPSLVISLLALFVSLGGASYAAIKIPRNSVGNKQLRSNAVTSAKVRNDSLLAEDFKAGQLPRGPQGIQGERGEPGATGATGTAGPTASASASNDPNPNIALTPVNTLFTVLDTAAAGPEGSGPMTVTVVSRVVAQASITVYKGTAQWAAASDAECLLQAVPVGGSAVDMSQFIQVTMPPSVSNGAVVANIALSGSRLAAPGQYTFRVRCRQPNVAASTAAPTYALGDLFVVASAI